MDKWTRLIRDAMQASLTIGGKPGILSDADELFDIIGRQGGDITKLPQAAGGSSGFAGSFAASRARRLFAFSSFFDCCARSRWRFANL